MLVLLLSLEKENIIISPSPDEIIHKEDLLVMIGNREDIAKFSNIE